jgi:hypothetical protein
MATITLFDVPSEVINNNIYSQLPKTIFLTIRLVSKAGLNSIKGLLEAAYPDTTLDGAKVTINFAGKFKKTGPAFFKHMMKMATLKAHPELLDVLDSARTEMKREGHKGSFTVQHFLDYLHTFDPLYSFGHLGRPTHEKDIEKKFWKPGIWLNSLPLALVPFDLCKPELTVTYRHPENNCQICDTPLKNEKLPLALSAAAETNSLDLVKLVLFHPNAIRLKFDDILYAIDKSEDPNIRSALEYHICDHYTYFTLKSMVESNQQYSPKEYAKVFIQFSFRIQKQFYKDLCKKYGSSTKNVRRDGMVHFIKNPKKCLRACLTH